jgi:AcrR family transcriptional regulator
LIPSPALVAKGLQVTTTKRAAKVEQIHRAAARCFAERGFDRTRMQDIADAVEMQAGSLYYYFESKEALLASIVGSRVGAAVEMLSEVAAGGGTPTEKLRGAVSGHLRVFADHADLFSIYNFERLIDIAPDAARQVDARGREYEQLLRGIVEAGMRAGEFRDDLDLPVVVKAIVGMCNSPIIWFDPTGRLSIEDVAKQFAELIVGGLAS